MNICIIILVIMRWRERLKDVRLEVRGLNVKIKNVRIDIFVFISIMVI